MSIKIFLQNLSFCKWIILFRIVLLHCIALLYKLHCIILFCNYITQMNYKKFNFKKYISCAIKAGCVPPNNRHNSLHTQYLGIWKIYRTTLSEPKKNRSNLFFSPRLLFHRFRKYRPEWNSSKFRARVCEKGESEQNITKEPNQTSMNTLTVSIADCRLDHDIWMFANC